MKTGRHLLNDMNFKKFLSLIFTAFILAGHVRAEELEPPSIDCTKKKLLRVEEIICLIPEVADVDTKMNRVYQNTLKMFRIKAANTHKQDFEAVRNSYVKAQKYWLAYRDSYCNMESLVFKNQDQNDSRFTHCLIEMTKERVEELRLQRINFSFFKPE